MVGGDRIEEQAKYASVDNVLDRFRRHRHTLEVRGVTYVRRTEIPRIRRASGDFHLLPVRVPIEYARVFFLEHFGLNNAVNDVLHFMRRWPDVPQINRLAALVRANRIFIEVDL